MPARLYLECSYCQESESETILHMFVECCTTGLKALYDPSDCTGAQGRPFINVLEVLKPATGDRTQ